MADTWPVTLPQRFEVNGYREVEADVLLQTPDEVLVPKTRRMSSAAARPVDGWMPLDLTQVGTLRTFGRVTLLNWSLPFWLPAQTEDEDPSNPGFWLMKFRKDGIPNLSAVDGMGGDFFRVALGLYRMP